MKASREWLEEYSDIDVDTVKLGDILTMTGSKVETIEQKGNNIKNVVVGKILEVTKHPDADKLVVTKIDVGNGEILQIVTAAPNIKVGETGQIVPVAKDGAEYLSKLGFSERFCRICEGANRYSGLENREKESDILELVDQFGGMLLDRPERIAFKVDEALVLLEYRNLKDKPNRYLEQFKDFVNQMEAVLI